MGGESIMTKTPKRKAPKKRVTTEHPALEAKIWAWSKIKPYDKNPKLHPKEQIDLLEELLVRYGVDQPIVVDELGEILKGHGRRLAGLQAKANGHKQFDAGFPVVQRLDLSEDEKREMRIADNQIPLLAGWDRVLLRGEVAALQSTGHDLKLLGFDNATLSWMTTGDLVADGAGEWNGMPEFQQDDQRAFRSIIVHFKDQAALDLFAKTTKQKISDKTKSFWYPEIEITRFVKYAGEKK